jgi:DNA-binding beta-propeller fold protein YncE
MPFLFILSLLLLCLPAAPGDAGPRPQAAVRADSTVAPEPPAGRDSLRGARSAAGSEDEAERRPEMASSWRHEAFRTLEGEGWTLVAPQSVVVDFRGRVYVGGRVSGKIVRLDRDLGGLLEFQAADRGARFSVGDLALHGFYLYVLEERRPRLVRFSNRGSFTDVLLDFSAPGKEERRNPVALDVDPAGRILLAFEDRHEIVVLTPFLDTELTFGEFGSHESQLNSPRGVAYHPDGGYVICDTGNARVVRYDLFGEAWATGRAPDLESPQGVAVSPGGTIAVADPVAGAVFLFDPGLRSLGRLPLPPGEDRCGPRDVGFDGDDRLYAADPLRGGIHVWRRDTGEE